MDLFLLDNMFRRRTCFDKYKSLIWSERWREIGDFELLIESNASNRRQFKPNIMVAIERSLRVMVIETVEDTLSSDGEAMLKVTGRSLEKILQDRFAKFTTADLTTEPTWNFNGVAPRTIVKVIFDTICIDAKHDPRDLIPYCLNTVYLSGNIPYYTSGITMKYDPQPLWDIFVELMKTYDFGLRLVKANDVGANDIPDLRFQLSTGNDRTSNGPSSTKVIFAEDLDNLQDTTELSSIDGYKNVAYVTSPHGFAIVYPLSGDSGASGFERQVLTVVADDIEDDSPVTLPFRLRERGQQMLADHNRIYAFDGELKLNSGYEYRTHYDLGDRVEMKTRSNVVNAMRVSEQIFICDDEGYREYPTLELDAVIQPDTWAAAEPDDEWIDHGATDYWSTA